jgi:glycosyltransferase involved in cell wall biosynthesis
MGSINNKKLQVAIMGTRGVPARYGGFETFAEQLGVRLAARGHAVTVYCRCGFFEHVPRWSEYRGITLRTTPTLHYKYLDTPVHALTSFVDLLWRKFDVVLLCNAANSPLSLMVRAKRIPLLINVDGIERKRAKWGLIGKVGYRLGELCSVLFATRIVADAQVIADYYKTTYRQSAAVIAYGAQITRRAPGPTLAKFNLKTREYLLYVSRLEPENNALGGIEAYRRAAPSIPLVIVGDAPYATEYKARLRDQAPSTVIFTGFQFGEAYEELQSNCYAYIQATEVGGTHPALVEAMAYGNCVIANGTPENHETLGHGGMYYEKNNFEQLARCFREICSSGSLVAEYRVKAEAEARRFSWDTITEQYETLFYEVCERS